MTEQNQPPIGRSLSALSRRDVLKGGLMAGSAAFIAACGAAATASPAGPATPAPTLAPGASPTPTPEPVSYAGVTLNNHTGGYSIPAYQIGLDHWKAETGGNATFTNIPFDEKPVKLASFIATQDSSWDLHYTYDNFMQRFGARLLLPLEGNYTGDLSDFVNGALAGFTTQTDQVLRGLPIHFSAWLWTWNPELFTKIGEDGSNPPDTYEALFALTPKFVAEGIIPCAQPWQGAGGTFAKLYWTHIYNSTGHPMFSDDRTQLMFDGPEGLSAFRTIEAGLKSGWWDARYLNITNEHEAYVEFAKGNMATVMHSESAIEPTEKELVAAGKLATRQFPGITPGTTGSAQGADGTGVNKWTKQPEASWSYFNRTFTPDVALEISLHEPELYPPTRNSVYANPDVIAAQPLIPAHQAQAKGATNLWSTPYDYAPVFDDVVNKMIKGEYSAQQAQDAAVAGVQDVIIKYLSA
ncbi:MAG: extracellular solute-binding protein [Chloroflexota bacterium]|nr:extracellular solute-binding protein [Chloroflexota bacterium]